MKTGGPSFRSGRGRFEGENIPGAKLQFRRLLNYLKPYKLQVVLSLSVSVLVTLLHLIPPRLIGLIIDRGIGKGQIRTLYTLAFSLLGIYITSHILDGLKGFLMGRLGQKIVYDMWQDVYRNLQRLSFSFYDNTQTGNIMSRITNDVGAVERVIVDGVDVIIISVLTLMASPLFYSG